MVFCLRKDILVYQFTSLGSSILVIRLPPEIENRLDEVVRVAGRSKTFYAREAILAHLDDLEDLYLAEQCLIDLRVGRTQAISLDDVMIAYGLTN